jgi:hypothetical protein
MAGQKKSGTHTDDSGLTDEMQVEVNGNVVQGKSTLPSVPDRPTRSAAKADWVDYAVAYGLDRGVAEQHTSKALGAWVDGEPLPPLQA